MRTVLALLLLPFAAPVHASREADRADAGVAAVLADLNAQERWLYDAYVGDAARAKALRIRAAQADLSDADEKRKFLAGERKKLVSFAEREHGLDGAEFAMLSAVLADPAKAAAFKREASSLAAADKAAQKAFVGRWRKEVVGWADAWMGREAVLNLKAKTVETMVGKDERALMEQLRRNDERGFKVGVFTGWVADANRKLAGGDPSRAVEVVGIARGAIRENLQEYFKDPQVAGLREQGRTLLARKEKTDAPPPPAKKETRLAEAPPPSGKKPVRESLERAEKALGAARSASSAEEMLASAGAPFGDASKAGRVTDAVSAGGYTGAAKPSLAAAQTGPVSRKGFASKSVPEPKARSAERGASSSGASSMLAPGLGAAGLGLIGFALLGPLGALVGALAGLVGGLFADKACKSCGK